MRKKLEIKEDTKKKQKRNQWILGIILIVVMFGSVFGVIVGSIDNSQVEEEKIIYGGLEFQNQAGYYLLNLGDRTFYFSESPQEYSSLEYEMNLTMNLADFLGYPLYIESEDYLTLQEVAQNIQGYPERIQPACVDEETCFDTEYPIKDCSNNFIIIRESENNNIYEKDSCIFIEGKQEDLLKLTDIAILKILGIN